MGFIDKSGFKATLRSRGKDQFFGMANEVARSVIDGSEITGAPGQPVDTAALKTSWIPAYTSPTTFQMTTNSEYAQPVEDGVGSKGQPVTYGKKTGGSHSVKMTEAGIQAIADKVARDIAGGDA